MPYRYTGRRLITVWIVFVTLAVVMMGIGSFVTPVAANHRDSPNQANFTLTPQDAASRHPGATNATWYLYTSEVSIPSGGFKYFNYTMARSGVRHEAALSWAGCTSADVAAYGIDRGNDDPGTTTDVGLLSKTEGTGHYKNRVWGQFFEPNDFAGQTVYFNESDQIVVKWNGCIRTTDEPGWYQFSGLLNGTTWNGEFAEGVNNSHYVAICDCQNREEARQKLGPPPSEQSGGQTTPTQTPTATPATTDTPTVSPTPVPNAVSTPTPTAVAQQGNNDGGEKEADRSSNGPETSDGNPNNNANAASNEQRTATSANEQIPVTPTIADGPGFGAGLALVTLFAAAGLALRRF